MSHFLTETDCRLGGASGIGLSTISVLNQKGAIVVFGDISSGEAIAKDFDQDVDFVKTDVTKYADLLALFDLALKKYGRVDCAISNAGAMEQGNWVNPDLDLEGIREVRLSSNSCVRGCLLNWM